MIYITGDLHGDYDIHKLRTSAFPEQKNLCRDDYLIICGDFGLLWDGSETEKYWLKWLDKKPWTTLWIDGNHENYNMLAAYPTEEWHGGMVQKITKNIIHLCRGYVFDIDGITFFAFGGAESHDKEFREPGVNLWEQELPDDTEMARGIKALDAVGWTVDIVLTHSLPSDLQTLLFGQDDYRVNRLTDYLSEVNSRLTFRHWFTGHYHRTFSLLKQKYQLVYNNIIQLPDKLKEET